jgi:ABC-type uncharacterized transport system substrate-binding protein
MLRFLRLLMLGLMLGLPGLGLHIQAQVRPGDARVIIVSSDTTTAYVDAEQALTDGLVRDGVSRYEIRQMTVTEFMSIQKAGTSLRPHVFVALGTDAAAALAQGTTQAPVLCFLIPRSSFERILRNSGKKASSLFAALYLDQPLGRQLTLIRLALPAVQRVGVLWGPESIARAPFLRSAASANGLSVVETTIDSQKAVFPGLKQVLTGSDVLLALADPMVYNSNSLQNILLSAFRERVPMLAFSPAYVRAGALLGLYVTPVQAGAQAAALVQEVLRDRPLPAVPAESNDFEVAVNEHVARALNLSLDAKALRLELRRLEHLP